MDERTPIAVSQRLVYLGSGIILLLVTGQMTNEVEVSSVGYSLTCTFALYGRFLGLRQRKSLHLQKLQLSQYSSFWLISAIL